MTSDFDLAHFIGTRCPYCAKVMFIGGRRKHRPSRDHILPRSLGGVNRAVNRLVVCTRCNEQKGDMHPDEWLDWLRQRRPSVVDQVAAIYAARLDAARAVADLPLACDLPYLSPSWQRRPDHHLGKGSGGMGSLGGKKKKSSRHTSEYADDGARPMPSFLDPMVAESAREKRLKLSAKSGRSSTNLSNTNGTRPYVNTFLGGSL